MHFLYCISFQWLKMEKTTCAFLLNISNLTSQFIFDEIRVFRNSYILFYRMGRKDFSNPDTVKRGPGKAAKRQQDFKGINSNTLSWKENMTKF